ncbi:polyketide biosynthesis cytochrome P450 PksS [Dictyobacter sp. S3.2.2.5]|uniref:Polyketide biosynthesis cytochrome P450 PksS n=1 Tax=Dictyobacter halimunensis TaxID=3026934 RepID=A0ABQ6FKM9_9CHLR|nr:polyketide biosynthesis cytochrome P450 PksS [Dictyobacter sp. S3.2.2.5]
MENRLPRTGSDEMAFGLLSGALAANPFPMLAQMRSQGALVPLPLPIGAGHQTWMITRMEDAVRVLKDQAHFTVNPTSIGMEDIFMANSVDALSDPSDFLFRDAMISVDEPDHRRLRRLVSQAFTPRYIESLRPTIQHMADELLDAVQDQGQMDLVQDFAYPLPINVISEMLGVPHADQPQLRVWSEALARRMPGLGRRDEQSLAHIRAFAAYARQLVVEKRQHPANDLTSQLVQMKEAGDHLSEDELLSMITLLIFAGHETTSNLIGIGTLTLLDHPDQLAKLQADLSLVPAAVEELLRFNGPVTMGAARFATEDLELAGQPINKGDVLLIALSSANRDETQFTQPDELDIVRTLGRHIAFGQGIHICLGAPLARLEGEIAFTTLLKRMPALHLNVPREIITWRLSSNVRGLTALPVAF